MIEKIAILEFKFGEAERGKTLFEGLLERSGKKLDLWSVYIDQMARTGDIQGVRYVLSVFFVSPLLCLAFFVSALSVSPSLASSPGSCVFW
jgi:hypothetical protein